LQQLAISKDVAFLPGLSALGPDILADHSALAVLIVFVVHPKVEIGIDRARLGFEE
jgi:hypothetical protein